MNTGHTISEIYVHIVWSTKNRQPLITPDIRNQIYSAILNETKSMDFHPLSLVGIEDHVHLLVRCQACFDIPALMQKVKGASSHFVNHILSSPEYFSWKSGYYVCSVSPRVVPTVDDYISKQAIHHNQGSLNPELEVIIDQINLQLKQNTARLPFDLFPSILMFIACVHWKFGLRCVILKISTALNPSPRRLALMTIPESSLREIRDRSTLYDFLNRQLGWPVNPEDIFTYPGPALDSEIYPDMQVSRIVPFTSVDPFAVMLVESDKTIKRSHLREILSRIWRNIRDKGAYHGRETGEFLFLCAEQGYDTIRFARFTPREKGSPKLSVFGWSRDSIRETRTIREMCLQKLNLSVNLIGEPAWSQCHWEQAWDVESVTKEFFTRYHVLFDEVEGMVSGVSGDKRFFTQRLFNRLMFIHFLSKKRWLSFNGSHDYLVALWEGRDMSQAFYNNHLIPLFFAALNNPQARDLNSNNPSLAALAGDVPYLNGGLFEQSDDECMGEIVPDEIFERIINDLFAQFNFTITESSPDDMEVAVDPEMLGKVFEELVNGRHETGSYYTPRPIVSFMCKEALKGFLGGYENLVDEHDANNISVNEAKGLLSKLDTIKVVDPACGSGAYLLGMLHELHALHRALDTRADRLTARDDYQRKLAIIQNNLYGVDVDPFAVNISRLRLWLSLAVEHAGNTPEPLPNLDFKIEEGDSLLSPNPNVNSIQTDMVCELTNRYIQMKLQYADPYQHHDKPSLKKDIGRMERELAEWMHGGANFKGFDWRVKFSEVYARAQNVLPQDSAGFDIVLANPPYV